MIKTGGSCLARRPALIRCQDVEKKMNKTISLTFLQRDTVRAKYPELWRKCKYLETGKLSVKLYSWNYTTTVENALALRLMGLCSIEDQSE